jgi:hypothetical protein
MIRILLLTIVLAAAGLAACGKSQEKAATETPSAPPAGDSPGAAANANVPPQLLALLPATNDVPGWTVSKAPRAFTPDTLYELINGAADGFITYGVQAVVTSDYQRAGTGDEVVVEVYQMKDALNAFGKYSEERGPDYRFLQIGNEGYSGGTTVNFWAGPYYVKLTAFEEKDELAGEMAKLAAAIASKVTTPGAEPRELAWFPKANQLPRTSKYIPKDVLAQSYLTKGFEARYKAGTREARLVLVDTGSAAAAGDALTRYRQALAKSATDMKDIAAPGEGGFAGKDSFYGAIVAVRAGGYLAVALGAPNEDAGKKQVGELVRNIR